LPDRGEGTTLHHLFTGREVRAGGKGLAVGELLEDFPVAVLERES
jgi:hypothetical protein